jgi:transcriptional regulator with XRE-family HTH domain
MASVQQGPTTARRRLSHALRAARDNANRTQEQAADALEWSISKMIRIENGRVKPTVTDVKALLQFYGVTEQGRVEEFVALARAARQTSWWNEYRSQIPKGYAEFIALEAEASALSFFSPIFIPGLLQTDDYAKEAVHRSLPGALSDEDQKIRVEVRRKRQEHLLYGERRPRIDVILDESVLRRVARDAKVMREQLLHLIALGSDEKIAIRVLPFSAGVHMVFSPIILLEFPAGTDPDVVYLESAISETSVLDNEDVTPYWGAYRSLAARAMTQADSLAFIAEVASEYR